MLINNNLTSDMYISVDCSQKPTGNKYNLQSKAYKCKAGFIYNEYNSAENVQA